MNYSFEYIDIILLAMIAGFIFLRLRGILGKRTGFEGKAPAQFQEILKNVNLEKNIKKTDNFDDAAKKEFLSGAKIAYETIITDFSDNDNKLTTSKSLLNKKIFDQFNQALQERSKRGHYAEITFIGVDSAKIKEHKKIDSFLQVTVDFVGEVITCIRDKEKRDWENLLSQDERLPNKDLSISKDKKITSKLCDLHGYSLDDANEKVNDLIRNSYEAGISKLVIVTGKGLHSENEKNPYISKDLGILKYSVPEYIENDRELMNLINNIKEASIEDGGSGAFYIYLKKKLTK